MLSDSFSVSSCSKQSGFVEEIFEVCACEALSSLSNYLEVDIRTERFILGMNMEYFLSALDIGVSDNYLSVETTGTEKCRVELEIKKAELEKVQSEVEKCSSAVDVVLYLGCTSQCGKACRLVTSGVR